MEESDTTKYVIHAHISAEGVVERPDVVGAVFGQTEGLLGADLDLRELQKTGRIGRIEVNITSKYGKSSGNILIPSSLDKIETSILAAALETIDRVGPCISKISVTKIEDVRSSKRQQIIERAKHILTAMFDESVPESQELTDAVKQAVRVEEVTFIDNLPAGPERARLRRHISRRGQGGRSQPAEVRHQERHRSRRHQRARSWSPSSARRRP